VKRKTLNVAEFVVKMNDSIARSTGSADVRTGLMAAIESVLFETGNYKGFCYLTVNDIPAGQLPGINLDAYGQHHEDFEMRFENTDRTRVHYFY
jgi:hypothetical protein